MEPGAVGAMDMTGMSIPGLLSDCFDISFGCHLQIFNLLAALFFAVRRLWVVAMRFYEDKKEPKSC